MIENDTEIRSTIIQKMIGSIIAETNDLRISRQDLEDFYSVNKDLFTPSPKLQLLKLSFNSNQTIAGNQARDLLIEGDLVAAKQLAKMKLLALP
jgi:hypothetical protein